MTAITYADRAEWLEARRGGIGGSDAAAILGVSRWSTAYDVWEDKVTTKPERSPTARMQWGRRLEAVVAEALAEERGIKMRRVNRILVHRELPFVFGSLDRVTKDAVVEIKVSRSGDSWATEEEAPSLDPIDRVPRDYYVQGQHYAAVARKPRVLFGVLIGGNDLRLIEVPADPTFIDDLMTTEADFWHRYVETGVAPPLTGGDADRVRSLYPTGAGQKVATPEIDELVRELVGVRARLDAEERRKADLEVAIQEYLGDQAADLVSSVTRVTWRPKKASIAWGQVAGAYRSAIERFRAETLEPDSFLDTILSEGFGTTNLDEAEELFRGTPSRQFLIDWKGAKP